MDSTFHTNNRQRFYTSMQDGSIAVFFAGNLLRKTADEDYPFFANRNFVYLTGITQEKSILLAIKNGETTEERLYMLPPDMMAERWNGRRMKFEQTAEACGVEDIRSVEAFERDVDQLLRSHRADAVYLDLDKYRRDEHETSAYAFARYLRQDFPDVAIHNALPQLRKQRTFKQPCEITAMRRAEEITRDGVVAMMKASRPGMYEYQYRAEFDYALAQHGVLTPMFPPIISAGANNFIIHNHEHNGIAHDGDLVLNDVGAAWDNVGTDVSRAFPVNGRFSDKQRLLYECAYAASNYMFSIIKPGMLHKDVDATIKRYTYELLKDAGVVKDFSEIGTYMWHGGAHHVGWDTHDIVGFDLTLAPGMVFCVDVGIYHEAWGTGFRLEDNCLVTELGCENLSAITPRSIEDIEAVMRKS